MRQLETLRFGRVSFHDDDIVHFDAGIPGFEHLKQFVLLEGADYAPFKFFQAVDDPNISLPLLRPHAVRSDYHFDLAEEQRETLEITKPEEAAVLCVVTVAEDPSDSTINLFAPVIINVLKRKAAQVILFGSDYPVAAPLIVPVGDG